MHRPGNYDPNYGPYGPPPQGPSVPLGSDGQPLYQRVDTSSDHAAASLEWFFRVIIALLGVIVLATVGGLIWVGFRKSPSPKRGATEIAYGVYADEEETDSDGTLVEDEYDADETGSELTSVDEALAALRSQSLPAGDVAAFFESAEVEELRRYEVSSALAEFLADNPLDAEDQMTFVRAIDRWNSAGAVTGLVRALRTRRLEDSAAQIALPVLADTGDPRAAEAIAEYLGHETLGAYAESALRSMGPTARPAVEPYVGSPVADADLRARRLMDDFDGRADPSDTPFDPASVGDSVADSPDAGLDNKNAAALAAMLWDPTKGQQAAQALLAMGAPAGDHVLPYMNHREATARDRAREILLILKVPNRELVDRAIEDLRSGDSTRQQNAMQWLLTADMNDLQRGLAAERFALLAESSDGSTQLAAQKALARWGTAREVQYLIALLESSDESVWSPAMVNLLEINDPATLPLMAPRVARLLYSQRSQERAFANLVASDEKAEGLALMLLTPQFDNIVIVGAIRYLRLKGTQKALAPLMKVESASKRAGAPIVSDEAAAAQTAIRQRLSQQQNPES